MSMFDKIKGAAENLAEQHGDKIEQGLDKAAEVVKGKVADEHDGKVDTAVDKAKDFVGKLGGDDEPSSRNKP